MRSSGCSSSSSPISSTPRFPDRGHACCANPSSSASGRRSCGRSSPAAGGFVGGSASPRSWASCSSPSTKRAALAAEAQVRRGAARAARDRPGAVLALAPESLLRAAAQDAGGRGRPAGRGAHRPRSRGCFASPTRRRCAAVVALCGRLQLHQAVPGLGRDDRAPDPAIRLAAVQTLASWAPRRRSPWWTRRIEDTDRACGWPRSRGGRPRLQGRAAADRGRGAGQGVKEMDLTEKMAFFEAYGAIAGAAGLKPLSAILLPARPAQDEGAAGNPRLRRDGAGPDQDRRGS